MDKLRHIDELLKGSLGQSVEAGIYTSDWLAIEKRLKRRKNRIYAMWFSLSLMLLTSVSIYFINQNSPNTTINKNITQSPQVEKPIPTDPTQTNIGSVDMDSDISQYEASVLESNPIIENSVVSDGHNSNRDNVTSAAAEISESNPVKLNTHFYAISDLNNRAFFAFPWNLNDQFEELSLSYLSDNNKKKKSLFNFGHIEVGVSFTPSMASKWTAERSNLSGLIHQYYRGIAANSESAAFAYSTSFNFEYHFRSNWFIGTGLGLTQRTESVNYNYTNDSIPIVDEVNNEITGYAWVRPQDQETVEYSGSNSYHFIEIPLTIGHAISLGKHLQLRNQVDLSYMLLFRKIGQKVDYTYLELNDLNLADNFNKSNISTTFKSGVYLNFENFVVGAEPMFSMNLNSLSSDNSALIVKPYNYGFNLTTNIKLNRK